MGGEIGIHRILVEINLLLRVKARSPFSYGHPVTAASGIQVNVACNSLGVFDMEYFQRIAESTFSKLLKL